MIVRPYIDHVMKVFGPERCMFGGDWPVSVLAGGYVKAWSVYREVAAGWPADVQAQVCNGTARAFYGLSV